MVHSNNQSINQVHQQHRTARGHGSTMSKCHANGIWCILSGQSSLASLDQISFIHKELAPWSLERPRSPGPTKISLRPIVIATYRKTKIVYWISHKDSNVQIEIAINDVKRPQANCFRESGGWSTLGKERYL